MKRNLIDASQLELEDKVVSIKRVTKVVTVSYTHLTLPTICSV